MITNTPEYANQRLAILVDSQNLYHSAKHLYNKNIDYTKLKDVICGDRALVRAIIYVIEAGNEGEKNFFEALDEIGFETKKRRMKQFQDGSKKADLDIDICVDAFGFILNSNVDTIALCTGDSDFVPLVNLLQSYGIKVEIWSFKEATSDELIQIADSFQKIGKPQYLLG